MDDLQLGELDFEQFLELVLKRTDSNLVSVFREMASAMAGAWGLVPCTGEMYGETCENWMEPMAKPSNFGWNLGEDQIEVNVSGGM